MTYICEKCKEIYDDNYIMLAIHIRGNLENIKCVCGGQLRERAIAGAGKTNQKANVYTLTLASTPTTRKRISEQGAWRIHLK